MDKDRGRDDRPEGTTEPAHAFMTFQESAKKFKPGPVAPPEVDAERPDMGGLPPTTATGAVEQQPRISLPGTTK